MPTLLEHLRRLVSLTGPSGQEEEPARYIHQQLQGLAEVRVDPLGNIIATRKGTRTGARSLAISAHMDEVGFIVRQIEPQGFIRFEKLGGHDDRVMLAQRVWVRGSQGRVLGVIGCQSAHLSHGDRDRVMKQPEMYVDIGARSAEEVQAMGIRPGDPIGYVSELTELGVNTGRYVAKSLDDRAGCALLIALLEALKGQELPGDLSIIFSVQEEVGLRGARTAGFATQADVALAVDMTAANDTPDYKMHEMRLGAGPAIKVMDKSLLAHPAVRRELEAAAKRAGIPYQMEVFPFIGTDAGELHMAGRGAATGAVSVTNRYTHSAIELVDIRDLEAALALLKEFVLGLQEGSFAFI